MQRSSVLYLLVAVCSFLLTSCKKNTANTTLMEGRWELRQASGMITIDYPAGSGHLLIFTTAGYQKYDSGQLVKSGSYVMVDDNTAEANTCLVLPAGQYTKRIIYDNNSNAQKIFLQLEENKLSFISGCYAYDAGHTLVYKRVGD